MDPDHFGNRETELGDLMEGFGSYEFSCSKNYDELNVPFDYQFQSQIDDLGGTSNRVLQTDNPRDRKKRNDKEYRARCREAQKRQEEELEKLAVENERMKNENESLVKERVTVLSPKLESAAIEINRLRSESQSLKRSSDNQIILVHALTEKLLFVCGIMKHKDGKPGSHPDKNSRAFPMAMMFVVLCGLSFYLGGIFCSERDKIEVKDVAKVISSPKESSVAPLQIKSTAFPECSSDYQDYTPCTDPRRWKKYGNHRLTFMERHCPPVFERKECLVPPPEGYKPPITWPKSRDQCWYRNVPYDWINKQKSNQNWLRKEGEKFLFPGGGTMFPRGVGAYVDLMQDLIPEMKDGTIRTAIDTGCGVASWGGDLLDRGILTVSLAPRDNHEAQVQFALERGIPAILGIISTQRLPFPSNAFDMAHCSRCLIPWTEFGGIYLLEVHRILRPGGFWVLSGPPVNYENRWRGWNTTVEEQKSDYEKLQELLTSMCFKLYDKKDDIAVWQKASDNSCYSKLTYPDAYPPKCDDSLEPDSAWYTPFRPCVVVPSPRIKKSVMESIPKWPQRLHVTPERILDVHGGSASAFKHDDSKWKIRAKHYKKLLPALGSDKIRNVMDMNTVYGGFAAAVIDDPLWVMNVVSSYAANTLPVVFDRGLIGTFHDWCEAFSTYPRTYDLLHLDGLFTAESHRCDIKYVLLEMDRILRPAGYAIIRESSYFMDAISTIAKGMRWSCRGEDTEYGVEKEKILICQKKLWHSSTQSSR